MIKKTIISIFILCCIPVMSYNNVEDDVLIINWIKIKWYTIYKNIDKKIDRKSKFNLENKKNIYLDLISNINTFKYKIWSKNTKILREILMYWYNKNLKKIDTYYSKTHKVILWYTKKWKEIIAYYRWNPKNGYFGIFSNIHWGYEYWSYNTAVYLLDELNKSWKTGRFIIPTINPEWLDKYLLSNKEKNFYVNWRTNSNIVDINRNFCTKSFELKTFIKNWLYLKTWVWWCNSEKETIIIIDTLKKYKFNQIISIHSEGHVFYIPENSFDDMKIRWFWSKVHEYLPKYEFNLSYENNKEKKQKVYEYEIDEWWSKLYTWTMETYIYEKYNIPVLLVELKEHWKTDYNFKNIINLLKK